MDLTVNVGETLKKLFPDIKQIRRNQLEQGHEPHSFYIRRGRTQAQRELMNRQMRVYPFILHYFPNRFPENETDKSETECEIMGERLMANFHYLNDHKARILNPYYEVHDGVLLFYFHIRIRVTLPSPEETKMGELEEGGYTVG